MNFKYIILALGFASLAVSCNEDKFLDIKPQGSLNDENLSNAEGVQYLVTAAYAALGGPAGQTNSCWNIPMTNWSYGEVRADNAYKGGGGVGDVGDIHRIETMDVDATIANLDQKWFQLYCCVQRCNSALRVLNQCSEADVPNLEIQKAEMRVLRAHFYFELSRLFNKIPYFDENVDEEEYVNIPNNQYTRDEILGMIAQELADAAEILPETQTEIGRVNKYVAYAYEAKVKLYQAYEQDETTHAVVNINKDLLREVVDLCNQLEGRYDLLDDFQQLDLLAYENGKESVFAVQYSMNDGSPDAGRINWSNLLNAPQGPYSGDGFFLPSQNLINAYQTDENGLPLFDAYADQDYDVIVFDEAGNAVNTQVDNNVDPRLDFIVGRPNITWKTYTETPCLNSWVRDQGTYGYHCCLRQRPALESRGVDRDWRRRRIGRGPHDYQPHPHARQEQRIRQRFPRRQPGCRPLPDRPLSASRLDTSIRPRGVALRNPLGDGHGGRTLLRPRALGHCRRGDEPILCPRKRGARLLRELDLHLRQKRIHADSPFAIQFLGRLVRPESGLRRFLTYREKTSMPPGKSSKLPS